MTGHVTIAEVQGLVAAKVGRDYFPSSEVQEGAATCGIAPRTLRRYVREGLVSAPHRVGRGRSRGVESRYPSRVILEIALVAEALRTTHSLLRIRHRLWWDGYPIEFERWRADRIEELARLALRELLISGMPRAQRDHMAAKLADELGNRRPFPLRRKALRTNGTRDQVAQWIFDARYGGTPPDPSEELEDETHATVGGVLDRACMYALRAAGWAPPVQAGPQIAELLVTVPKFDESFDWLTALTEADSRRLWRVATGLEALGLFGLIGAPPLRDAPTYAVLCLFYLHWAIPDAVIGELAALSPTAAYRQS
ncbi:MAG: hypothetical protein ACYDC5_07795 [Candidatus Dormibacteria bacterium]